MLNVFFFLVILFSTVFQANGQQAWKQVRLPENFKILPHLDTQNPLAPTSCAIAASVSGQIVFYGVQNEKGHGSVWQFNGLTWRHLIDYSLANGIPRPKLLPFPEHTWSPVAGVTADEAYFLNGWGDGSAGIIHIKGREIWEFGSDAKAVVPFRYFAEDRQTGEQFFLGQPSFLSLDPTAARLRPYGIYKITDWFGPFEPATMVVSGATDEEGFALMGPLSAASGYLVFWSGREVRSNLLPRLERQNRSTGAKETLLEVQGEFLGQNVLAIYSAATDDHGNVLAVYSTDTTRIAYFPVEGVPIILYSFEKRLPILWPPSVVLHEAREGRLLFSYPSGRSDERDTLAELDFASGTVKTILEFGDLVEARAVSSIGQFAAYYSGDNYIVQINGTDKDFGMLISGKPAEPEPKPDPEPVPNLGPVKFHRQRAR